MNAPFIKICGLTDAAAVHDAEQCGAGMLGFIFHTPSPRYISPDKAAALTSRQARRVGVFVRQRAEEIRDTMQRARLDLAQLHGDQSESDALAIGAGRIIRVLWPEQSGNADDLQRRIDAWAPYCAYYLLDTGTADASGGLGRQLDFARLTRLRFPHPWLLAGGLGPGNIAAALRACQPDGIDLNSGIELAPGVKSAVRMRAAVAAARCERG